MDERFIKILEPTPPPEKVVKMLAELPFRDPSHLELMAFAGLINSQNLWTALTLAAKTAVERAAVFVWYFPVRPYPKDRPVGVYHWLIEMENCLTSIDPYQWPDELSDAINKAIRQRPDAKAMLQRAREEGIEIPEQVYLFAEHLQPDRIFENITIQSP